jgi:hypothetical protein
MMSYGKPVIPTLAKMVFCCLSLLVGLGLGPCLFGQGTSSLYAQSNLVRTLQIPPQGQTLSFPFWVDQTTSCNVILSSVLKNLGMTLTDPIGNIYVFGQPGSDAFQSSLYPDPAVVPNAPGANYGLYLGNPLVGQWTLTVTAPTIQTAVLTLPARIAFNNQVGAVLIGGGGTKPLGQAIALAVAVMDGTTPVANPQVTATLYRLDDSTIAPVPVTFMDNGQGIDFKAGDNIYSACLVPTQQGDYLLQVDITGDASTGRFQRNIATGFKIKPKTASIVGTFQERVIVGGPK